MRHLASIGFEPRIAASVQDFAAVPFMVTGSARVAALPQRFAAQCTQHGDLRIEAFPVSVPPLVEAFWWHPLHNHDAGHRWLREEITAVVATLGEHP
jgi:DNA-binding transcriptional LysR family regulator